MTFATLDDVVAGLGSLETEFRRRKDRRCVFLSLYGIVSAEMRDRVRQQAFADPDWVHRYAVAFANLYTRALTAYDAGRLHEVPKAWRLCFDRARAGAGLVLQDMFLGVNAHVNADLPYALAAISIDPDRAARYQDHAAVNQVLGDVCAQYTMCRFDAGAVFDYPFSRAHVSKLDYFHPNRAGQAVLASVTWERSWWGTG